jgi:hypothetical protein
MTATTQKVFYGAFGPLSLRNTQKSAINKQIEKNWNLVGTVCFGRFFFCKQLLMWEFL